MCLFSRSYSSFYKAELKRLSTVQDIRELPEEDYAVVKSGPKSSRRERAEARARVRTLDVLHYLQLSTLRSYCCTTEFKVPDLPRDGTKMVAFKDTRRVSREFLQFIDNEKKKGPPDKSGSAGIRLDSEENLYLPAYRRTRNDFSFRWMLSDEVSDHRTSNYFRSLVKQREWRELALRIIEDNNHLLYTLFVEPYSKGAYEHEIYFHLKKSNKKAAELFFLELKSSRSFVVQPQMIDIAHIWNGEQPIREYV